MQNDSQMLIWLSEIFIASAMKVRIIFNQSNISKHSCISWELHQTEKKNHSAVDNSISVLLFPLLFHQILINLELS